MAIDPLILLPAAAGAVLLLIIAIRLIAGRREAELASETLAQFLTGQEPGEKIVSFVISEDRRYALVEWQNGKGIGLIRSFGDKMVLQMLGQDMLLKCDWREGTTILSIPRQGFAFPPVKFAVGEADRQMVKDYLNGEKDATA
ncbi:hypothetical protein [uncultured Sneathiella sp.]|uniref:hypothetical protein n=1 Tax=uncultured Sneathiella sp. TaxID=879315 RepID=UPI0025954F21|nr:hypothetical protein [uncultured Sneathiella sp.]